MKALYYTRPLFARTKDGEHDLRHKLPGGWDEGARMAMETKRWLRDAIRWIKRYQLIGILVSVGAVVTFFIGVYSFFWLSPAEKLKKQVSPKKPRIVKLIQSSQGGSFSSLGQTVPPEYQSLITSVGETVVEFELRKKHHCDQGWKRVNSASIVRLDSGLGSSKTYQMNTTKAIQSSKEHGVNTPYGIYDIKCLTSDSNGQAEKLDEFNYVCKLMENSLSQILAPVGNQDFVRDNVGIMYRVTAPRRGYSSSDVLHPFDFNRNVVIKGTFLLTNPKGSFCSLQIGLCKQESDGILYPQTSFIIGDGSENSFSIKNRDDLLAHCDEWNKKTADMSLVSNGKTENRFLIVVSEKKYDPSQVDCGVYLRTKSHGQFHYAPVFSRAQPRDYIPFPLMWVKLAGWKRGRITLRDLEIAEYDGRPLDELIKLSASARPTHDAVSMLSQRE